MAHAYDLNKCQNPKQEDIEQIFRKFIKITNIEKYPTEKKRKMISLLCEIADIFLRRYAKIARDLHTKNRET